MHAGCRLFRMIIVTGTRRSGTSAWMQILAAGGFRILGDKFPAHWKGLIKDANPRGFFETTLVQGINHETNPDPRSGAWLPPDKVADFGVKIFADGLVKTDYAYIDKVIFTIRDWAECEASQQRLDKIRDANSAPDSDAANDRRTEYLPIGFAWWKANFSLLRDMRTRQYPTAGFSFAALLQDPQQTIEAAFGWLGAGNVDDALRVVERGLRTQDAVSPGDVGHRHGDVFDELYDTLANNRQVSPAFFQKLEQTDAQISREIVEHRRSASPG